MLFFLILFMDLNKGRFRILLFSWFRIRIRIRIQFRIINDFFLIFLTQILPSIPGLEKTRFFLKKTQPSGLFGFFMVFWGFFMGFLVFCMFAQKRVFRVFSV